LARPNQKQVDDVSFGLLLDFGADVDGVWAYKDPLQVRLAQLALEVLEWDLVSFDAWLYGPDHWRSYPRGRQHLMGLREQLTNSLLAHADSETDQRQDIQNYFQHARRLALRMDNLPATLRLAMVAVSRDKTKRVASSTQEKRLIRIQQEYEDRVKSGQKYGAQSELARKYGLPLHTVRRSLKSLRNS
jgi:hypothetical protein